MSMQETRAVEIDSGFVAEEVRDPDDSLILNGLRLQIEKIREERKRYLENDDWLVLVDAIRLASQRDQTSVGEQTQSQIQQLGQDAKATMVHYAMPFMTKVANAIHKSTHSMDMEDFIQEGFFGLMEAVKRFDSEKGSYFFNFATICMRSAMNNAVGRFGTSPIVMQKTTAKKMLWVNNLREKGFPDSAITEELGISEEALRRYELWYNRARNVASIDDKPSISLEGDLTPFSESLGDLLVDDTNHEALDDTFERHARGRYLLALASKIPFTDTERKILLHYYGLDTNSLKFVSLPEDGQPSITKIASEHELRADTTYEAKYRLERKFHIADALNRMGSSGLLDDREILLLYTYFLSPRSCEKVEKRNEISNTLSNLRVRTGEELNRILDWVGNDLRDNRYSDLNIKKYMKFFHGLFGLSYPNHSEDTEKRDFISLFVKFKYIPIVLERLVEKYQKQNQN